MILNTLDTRSHKYLILILIRSPYIIYIVGTILCTCIVNQYSVQENLNILFCLGKSTYFRVIRNYFVFTIANYELRATSIIHAIPINGYELSDKMPQIYGMLNTKNHKMKAKIIIYWLCKNFYRKNKLKQTDRSKSSITSFNS